MVEVIFHRDTIIALSLFVILGGAVWLYCGEETKVARLIKFYFILLLFGLAGYAFHSYS